MTKQSVPERLNNFNEVALGYTLEEAMAEADRCLNCPGRYCAAHCPAHNYIPEFIAQLRAGNLEEAWQLLARTNPMMEISGRICPYEKQCESHCTRGIKCQPVAISHLERFVADWRRSQREPKLPEPEPNGMRVAIVGGGPAGIICAISLAGSGFQVTIYEKSSRTGGVVSWGIPSFVLPSNLIVRLSQQMETQGVEIKLNTELGKDITLEELSRQYDAVFVATGAEKPVEISLPGSDLPQVVQAKDYLTDPQRFPGTQVLVIGGGNTAINAARTAARMGAASASVIYRRTEAEMPATREEILLAQEEGIPILPLLSPAEFLAEDGILTGTAFQVMELTKPDYPGGRNNVAPTDETIRLDCDLAILALGFENCPVDGVNTDSHNRILVDKKFRTSLPNVFAGGDAVTGSATLMKAVAAGKDAAAAIFEWLSI
jgi:glutamate synthase (NADPH/NADH) small chain